MTRMAWHGITTISIKRLITICFFPALVALRRQGLVSTMLLQKYIQPLLGLPLASVHHLSCYGLPFLATGKEERPALFSLAHHSPASESSPVPSTTSTQVLAAVGCDLRPNLQPDKQRILYVLVPCASEPSPVSIHPFYVTHGVCRAPAPIRPRSDWAWSFVYGDGQNGTRNAHTEHQMTKHLVEILCWPAPFRLLVCRLFLFYGGHATGMIKHMSKAALLVIRKDTSMPRNNKEKEAVLYLTHARL